MELLFLLLLLRDSCPRNLCPRHDFIILLWEIIPYISSWLLLIFNVWLTNWHDMLQAVLTCTNICSGRGRKLCQNPKRSRLASKDFYFILIVYENLSIVKVVEKLSFVGFCLEHYQIKARKRRLACWCFSNFGCHIEIFVQAFSQTVPVTIP